MPLSGGRVAGKKKGPFNHSELLFRSASGSRLSRRKPFSVFVIKKEEKQRKKNPSEENHSPPSRTHTHFKQPRPLRGAAWVNE